VIECSVVAIPDELVSHRLIAFVQTRGEGSPRTLLAFCAERLPAYMLPESITFIDALPRTSTGKVDRQSLAARNDPPPTS
jgi:acyl-CoA synthetase (AMP-forming)/AMP-acid ligase II